MLAFTWPTKKGDTRDNQASKEVPYHTMVINLMYNRGELALLRSLLISHRSARRKGTLLSIPVRVVCYAYLR